MAASQVEVQNVAMSVSICLPVCPLAYLKDRISWNFLHVLPVAVARFSS